MAADTRFGTNTNRHNFKLGDGQVSALYLGDTRVWVNNLAPTGHTITSSVSGNADSGATVTFTSIVTDDNLVGGTYQWTANGTNVGTNSTTYTHSASNTTVAIQCTYTDSEGLSLASNVINQRWNAPSLMASLSSYSLSGLPDTFSDPPGQTGGNQTGHSGTISFTNNSGQTITMTGSSSGPTESVNVPATQTFGSGAHTIHLSYGLSWGNIEGQGRVSFSISVSFSAPGFAGFGQTLLSGTAGQPGS